MSNPAFLIIHGFHGPSPGHWLLWLHRQLEEARELVRSPRMPDPDHPNMQLWLSVLRQEMEAIQGREIVVLTQSCGSLLWLHHAVEFDDSCAQAARVLMVALPSPQWSDPDVSGFHPVPLSPEGLKLAAISTRMVSGTDDPFCPIEAARRYAEVLEIPGDIIPDGRHLNTDSGYGPWPAIRSWALAEQTPLGSNQEAR